MTKRNLSLFTAAALLFVSLCALPGCGASSGKDSAQTTETGIPQTTGDGSAQTGETGQAEENSTGQAEETGAIPEDNSSAGKDTQAGSSPEKTGLSAAAGGFANIEVTMRDTDMTPCVEPYSIAPDLGNVDNLWQFYLEDGMKDKLAQNGFVVCGNAGNEFFEEYESNRYSQTASFVTVDSLMHTYHLYFSHLMRNTEKNHLAGQLSRLSQLMLADSQNVYETLKGTAWEEAALRTAAFFTVGTCLLDGQTTPDGAAAGSAEEELNRILAADGIDVSTVTGELEDYSQYAPRGYYEGDDLLERYFRAMMWYGRLHFKQESEEMQKTALLITWMLSQDDEALGLWDAVYRVTSFFAGASDDPCVNEYLPILQEVYGENVSADALAKDTDAFALFCQKTKALTPPSINSQPILETAETNVIPGFRFMGQRFTIDGAVMQRLIYRNVEEDSAGNRRMLPDVLDVPAALGSDAALEILEGSGATDFSGYPEQMELLRAALSSENDALWSASLYSDWLHTLRPLLTPKKEGYPVFMQNAEWTKKDLECFAGSFAELKHDTVLYSKQVMAEMGGGWEEEPDDRGYVEPEPLVYARFAELADRTALGLSQYGMLTDAESDNLSRLAQIADTLLEISKKELQNETPTEEEFEFIRNYGGNLEHFWLEAVKDLGDVDEITAMANPAAVITDIATDPNGTVLEVGTGDPSRILVIVPVDGKIKLAQGTVYSFYQFSWPLEDRLTDSKWRQMLGIEQDAEGNFSRDGSISRPEWTESYQFRYEWE